MNRIYKPSTLLACTLAAGCTAMPGHSPRFVDTSESSGIETAGARSAGWADYNGDGCLDVLFSQATTPKLFRNNCDKSFSDVTASAGITGPTGGVGVAWADFDADGDPDVYIASGSGRNALYRNNGNGTFSDIAKAAGVDDVRATTGASWADFDNDGDLDLFVANRFYPKPDSDITDRLYRNNGNGTFTDVAPSLGLAVADRKSFMGTWFDYDNNGTQDLYLAIDFRQDRLYRNNGSDGFEEVSESAGISGPAHAMGVSVGDINGDGCYDLVVTNNTRGKPDDAEHGPTTLYQNDCRGGFSDRTSAWGIEDRGTVDWGVSLVDWDNDGDEDLAVVSGGMLKGGQKESNVLYENNGGRLINVTRDLGAEVNGAAFGSAWADYDNDGDLDWLIVNSKKNSVLLENQAANGNYLKVKLQGKKQNRDAVGARLELTSSGRTQVKTIQAGKGYAASEELVVNFGLGSADVVDSLRVVWPDGSNSDMQGVLANQTLKVRQ